MGMRKVFNKNNSNSVFLYLLKALSPFKCICIYTKKFIFASVSTKNMAMQILTKGI